MYQFALKCNRSSFSLILKEANGKDEPLRKRFPFAYIRDALNDISSFKKASLIQHDIGLSLYGVNLNVLRPQWTLCSRTNWPTRRSRICFDTSDDTISDLISRCIILLRQRLLFPFSEYTLSRKILVVTRLNSVRPHVKSKAWNWKRANGSDHLAYILDANRC